MRIRNLNFFDFLYLSQKHKQQNKISSKFCWVENTIIILLSYIADMCSYIYNIYNCRK